MSNCPLCPWPLEEHTQDFRFALPDDLADWSSEEVESRVSTNDTFMKTEAGVFYVRSILPVHLVNGHLTAYAVWIEVTFEDLSDASGTWDSPEYAGLTLTGRLANSLPPWPDLASNAEVGTEVRHLNELPYMTSSTDPQLQQILDGDWDHEMVLSTMPSRSVD